MTSLLETVDLTKWRDAQTKTLSGGMRRRLEIARGLVHSPKIFFLDEPTTGLDPVSRVAVWEMLTNIKAKRKLTMLITTHYMDEADRLCNRIAIVDHGKLVALDTPEALKASVPGTNVIEVQFEQPPADWEERLQGLPGVTSVQNESAGMFRVLTSNGSGTTTDLVEMAVVAKVTLKTLTVQNTTLDDVFVHYTGRQLRDELVKAYGFVMPRGRGCSHEPDDGDYRARDAEVFPLTDADDGIDGVAAGAVDRAGQCVWRKDPRREDGDRG